MKILTERDLGIDCDFVARGENTEEVVQAATEHVQLTHPDEYDRVKSMFKMHIKDEDEKDEDEEEAEEKEEEKEAGSEDA